MATLRQLLGAAARRCLPTTMAQFDLGRYTNDYCVPPPPTSADPWEPAGQTGHAGIDWRSDEQLDRVRTWATNGHGDLYRQLRTNSAINLEASDTAHHVRNRFFNTPDAEMYASMILDHQPDQIIEIGSGYSTRVARQAITFGNLTTTLRVVDPEPRVDILDVADSAVLRRVEDTEPSELALTERSLLFIDSSHICRPRGDLPYLFCQILPTVPKGVVVHVHDVFIPYDYPSIYDRWLWNEQYLVMCLLANSAKFAVMAGAYFLCKQHEDVMRSVISPSISATTNTLCGGSLWFRAIG